ncbi:MAG: hypothetical protein AAF847_12965 [Bacteroidota bacterium]
MQKYINQLLSDIAANTRPEGFFQKKMTQENAEDYFAEVERYVNEEPTESLGDQIEMDKAIFPDASRLTDTQCTRLVQALEKMYFSYGVALDIREGIPIKIAYQHFVEALDKNVFLEEFGTCTIEYCHYDFNGHCPFKMKSCPCYRDWEVEVLRIKESAKLENLEEMDALEVYWYDLLKNYEQCKIAFSQSETPNKASVQRLWEQLEAAHQVFCDEDASVRYGAKEEDLPKGDYRTLFDWLEVGKVTFPDRATLNDLELYLLTMALIQLTGKGLIMLHILDWSIERQYNELVAHHSHWMKKKEPYFSFVCQPQEENLYDKVRAEPSKFYSEYEDFIANPPDDIRNILWFHQKDDSEEDDLPF